MFFSEVLDLASNPKEQDFQVLMKNRIWNSYLILRKFLRSVFGEWFLFKASWMTTSTFNVYGWISSIGVPFA